MDNLVEIQIEYKYYCNNRITPIFISNEDLVSLAYDDFFSRVVGEVPYLAKVASNAESLRLIIAEPDRPEIDISSKYFKSQIMTLLNKGLKTIVVRVAVNESPLNSLPASTVQKYASSENVKSKRRLNLLENNDAENISSVQFHVATASSVTSNNNVHNTIINSGKDEHVVLPLERHSRRYEEIVESISERLAEKNRELGELDNKLSAASSQNTGHLSLCGNCHLKTGHTRKACQFSPCRNAFSCGILAKHNDQKSLRASITKDVTSLENQLRKAQTDLNCARTAMEKAKNSSSKRIEDILLHQKPDRYTTTCGRKNWLVLNKDVALLQSKLKGTLPTRTNIMNLLSTVVKDQQSNETCTKTAKTLKGTDHRVSSQRTALEEEYAIRFPVKRPRTESTKKVVLAGQEKEDFHLALRLQQEEMDSESDVECVSCTDAKPDEQELQFEANAAAALLCLKSRK